MVVAAIVDAGFYFVLAALAAREVMAAKNPNLAPVALVLLLGIANAADHAGAANLLSDAEVGIRSAISIVIMLISLIGGRIIPSFTRNWMKKQGITRNLPTQPTRFDLAVLVITAAGLLAWIIAPDSSSAGWLLIAAGCAQAWRLLRWGRLRFVRDPLVLILHVGYLWVPVGLVLLSISIFGASVPRSAAIHALTAGAMATMIIAVMTRAVLSHTGRDSIASLTTALIYILVTGGAVLRVAASLDILDYTIGIKVAAGVWTGAFVLFLATYGPMLVRPRLGEE